jgi:hypothetical protein
MSRRKWLQMLVVTAVTACLLVFSGLASAQQGNRDNAFERVKEVQERHTDRLMEQEGVVGTAVGLDEKSENAVLVLLERAGVPGIPTDLEGVPVRKVVTGKIYALPKPPSAGRKPAKTPPQGPSNLTATAINAGQIKLDWQDNSNNETGFRIERQTTGSFTRIATVGASVTSYYDAGLNPSTTYTYRVYAYNSAGNSAYSNEASATTPGGETSPYPRPAPIGVSTGHPNITAGTIGCRVTKTDGATTYYYALSNNHIYADENRASLGDNVLQPGPYDGGQNPRDKIGTLADFQQIVFSRFASNQIDAAIALCPPEMLGNSTPAGSYGVPSSTTVAAWVGLAVQKHGRTTGLTTGQVYAVNATVNVGYDSGTARFINQIVITPGAFSAGGDSGSLIVTQSGENPVGLLFAGSSSVTIANPIDLVLSHFGVTVDGE